jgi:hypothetical protein
MKKVLLAVLMVLMISSLSFASDFVFNPPATNADGLPIPETWESQLAYKFYCGFASQNYHIESYAGHLEPNAQNDCLYPINSVIPADGIWYCAATAYYLFDITQESAKSNEVFFVVSGGVVPSVAPGKLNLRFKK